MGRNDKRIRELAHATSVSPTDMLVIDQGGATAKYATVKEVVEGAGAVLDTFACFIGATAPTPTYAGQFWLDTGV
jgi:hypothetical protein